MTETTIEPLRLLRLPEILRRIPLSRSEWYRRVAAREAPQPVALGPRARAWREQDIQEYVRQFTAPVASSAP